MRQNNILLSLLLATCLIQVGYCDIFSEYSLQAQRIVSSMTLAQKIGQMTQPDLSSLTSDNATNFTLIQEYNLGSVLVGGNGAPTDDGNLQSGDFNYTYATRANWKKLADNLMDQTIEVRLDNSTVAKISLLLGTDAVHGNQHVLGEVLFPQNIGMAATHNPENFFIQGQLTANHSLASGWNYIFAPTVAVSHSPQWGRFYETLGQDPQMIKEYAKQFVQGAQQISQSGDFIGGAMTSTKHYLGDGATFEGHDEGDDRVYNYTAFYQHNIAGYQGAIEAQTGTVMCSYSAINNIPMSINGESVIGVLKGKEQFNGFVISDYDERTKIAGQGQPTSSIKMSVLDATCSIINAGIDMMMMGGNAPGYQEDLLKCVNSGDVSMTRIDDAVMRILAVKLSMGLVETVNKTVDASESSETVTPKQTKAIPEVNRDVAASAALKAAQESLVLLKNKNDIIPIDMSEIQYVILLGERQIIENGDNSTEYTSQDYNNIGAQNGGWSIRWQGYEGNQFWEGENKETSAATSIYDAFVKILGKDNVIIPDYSNVHDEQAVFTERIRFLGRLNALKVNPKNTLIVGTLAESPYAEFMGDINNIYCKDTVLPVEGCLYNSHADPYMPLLQKSSLNITYDFFSKVVLTQFSGIPVVTVLLSGRPMIINEVLYQSDAFIAAWLPGTTGGQAIVNAITGQYRFGQNGISNRLPVDWVQNMDSLENFPVYNSQGDIPLIETPLFPRGYGISTTDNNQNDDIMIDA